MPRTSQANDFHFRARPTPPRFDCFPPSYQSRAVGLTAAGAAILFLFTPGYFSVPVALTCTAAVDVAAFRKQSVAFKGIVGPASLSFKLLRTPCYAIIWVFIAVRFLPGIVFRYFFRRSAKKDSKLGHPCHLAHKSCGKAHDSEEDHFIADLFLNRLPFAETSNIAISVGYIVEWVMVFCASCLYAYKSVLPVLQYSTTLFHEAPVEKLSADICSENRELDWFTPRSPSTARKPVSEGMVRVRWYRDLHLVGSSISYLTADFPLDHEGNLSLAAIREKWGLFNCVPVDCGRLILKPFQPQNPDVLSALAVKVLTDQHPCLRVIEQPPPAFTTVRKFRAAVLEAAITISYRLKWESEQHAFLITEILFASFFYFLRICIFKSHPLCSIFHPIGQALSFMFLSLIHYAIIAFQLCHMHFTNLLSFYTAHYVVIVVVLFMICASYITFIHTPGPDPVELNYV